LARSWKSPIRAVDTDARTPSWRAAASPESDSRYQPERDRKTARARCAQLKFWRARRAGRFSGKSRDKTKTWSEIAISL
jgi:hypothetical protein